MTRDEVYNLVKELNISDKEDEVFKAAMVFLYGISNDTVNRAKIAKGLLFYSKDVNRIIDNLWENGIIEEYNYCLDFGFDDGLETIIGITVVAMAGAGQIKSYREPQEHENVIRHAKEEHGELWPLPKKYVRIYVNGEKNWVNPIKVEGHIITGKVISVMSKYYEQDEVIKFSYLTIVEIRGLKKHEVAEVKKLFEDRPQETTIAQ